MTKIERLVGMWAIGSGGDLSRRMIQWVTQSGSWPGFYSAYVRPVTAQGIKTIWLHSPMGREGTRTLTSASDNASFVSNYRFDEYLCARLAGMRWLTEQFVPTFQPVVKSGVKVVVYLGTLDGQFEFVQASPSQYLCRALDSLRPFLDTGCAIAIDSSCRAPLGSDQHLLMQLLKARGVDVLVEASPDKNHRHLQDWNMIVTDTQWVNVANPSSWVPSGSFPGLIPPSELGGRIYRQIDIAKPAQYPSYKEWLLDIIPQRLSEEDKYSVCAPLTHYLSAGGSIADLVK